MMRELFGHTLDRSKQLAEHVDSCGSVICLTTTREHAELKHDQIQAFGKDERVGDCNGAMSCSIEPED
jgi:ATP-dependent Clp protease adaptor protein ClpS